MRKSVKELQNDLTVITPKQLARIFLTILTSFVLLPCFAQPQATLLKIDSTRKAMRGLVKQSDLTAVASFYSKNATVDGFDVKLNSHDKIMEYWNDIRGRGVDWKWEIQHTSGDSNIVLQSGISHLTLAYDEKQITYSSRFSLIWERQPNGEYKILLDFYRHIGQFSTQIYEVERDSTWVYTGIDSIFTLIFKPKGVKTKRLPAIYCLQGGGNVGLSNYTYDPELFARLGITAIVCDKAGAGRSVGKSSWITQSFSDKVAEYSAILDWISNQSFVDPTVLGVHGPSEGGRLALSFALANPMKVKFINSVSAPIETLKENQLYAIEKLLISQGFDYSVIAKSLSIFDDYFDGVKNGSIPKDLISRIANLKEKNPNLYLPPASGNLPRMPRPEDIDFTLGGDIKNIKCPVFFQYGDSDAVVNVVNSTKLIPKRDNFHAKIYDRADHSINYSNGYTHSGYYVDKIEWLLSTIDKLKQK